MTGIKTIGLSHRGLGIATALANLGEGTRGGGQLHWTHPRNTETRESLSETDHGVRTAENTKLFSYYRARSGPTAADPHPQRQPPRRFLMTASAHLFVLVLKLVHISWLLIVFLNSFSLYQLNVS